MKRAEQRFGRARGRGTGARIPMRSCWLRAVALGAGIGLWAVGCRVERTSVVEPPFTVEKAEESGAAISEGVGEARTLAIGGRRARWGGLAPLASDEAESLWRREKEGFYHTARGGETLVDVARRYGSSAEELAKWNGLAAGAVLEAGQMIFVPKGGGVSGEW